MQRHGFEVYSIGTFHWARDNKEKVIKCKTYLPFRCVQGQKVKMTFLKKKKEKGKNVSL